MILERHVLIDNSEEWGDFVTVVVGREKQKFLVHQGLLRQHSTWFSNRMNGNWGNDKHIDLHEDNVETFALFVDFMYRHQLVPPVGFSVEQTKAADSSPSKRRRIEREDNLDENTIAELYVFADLRQCPQLRCAAVDAFRKIVIEDSDFTDYDVIDYVFANTPERCGLRQLIIDEFTKGVTDEIMPECDFPDSHEFMTDLARELYRTRGASGAEYYQEAPGRVDPCVYHDHEDEEMEASETTKT